MRHRGSLSSLYGMAMVFLVKCFQIRRIPIVTGAYFALFIFHNGVDSNRIILYQLIAYGKDVEFLNAHSSPANAVIQQHIELEVLFSG